MLSVRNLQFLHFCLINFGLFKRFPRHLSEVFQLMTSTCRNWLTMLDPPKGVGFSYRCCLLSFGWCSTIMHFYYLVLWSLSLASLRTWAYDAFSISLGFRDKVEIGNIKFILNINQSWSEIIISSDTLPISLKLIYR